MITYPPEYDWIPFYKEMADKLLQYKDDRKPLVAILNKIFDTAKLTNPEIKNPFIEKMAGNVFTDTCPFTVFASINRRITDDNRKKFLSLFKSELGIDTPVPTSFNGIPLLTPQHIWFYEESRVRHPEAIPNLWNAFECAIKYADNPSDENRKSFEKSFDIVTKQAMVKWNITIGLYWIRPEQYLNLDGGTRSYLHQNKVVLNKLKTVPSCEEYLEICSSVKSYLTMHPELGNEFYEFSLKLYDNSRNSIPFCWYLSGKYIDDDLTRIFLENGSWEANFDGRKDDLSDKQFQETKNIKPGDYVALFTNGSEKNNPPFNTHGKSLKYMDIHDYGKVVENYGNGILSIEWSGDIKNPKRWYYYVAPGSVWKVDPDFREENGKDPERAEMMRDLLNFTFKNVEQNLKKYEEIYNRHYGFSDMNSKDADKESMTVEYPKNIILYGPPGTGKTYNTVNYAVSIIRKEPLDNILAEDYDKVFEDYCKYKEENLIEFVTFHQSYSYEDFVEGIKPTVDKETKSVSYDVEDGVFKKFCKLSLTAKDEENLIGDNPKIWKVSLGQRDKESNIKEDCFKNSYIRIGFDEAGEEPDFETITEGKYVLSAFIDKMRIGDLVLILSDWKSIDAIGVITGDYQWLENQKEYKRCRKVKWFFTDKKVSIYELNGNTTLSLSTVYELTNISQKSVLTLIKENSDEFAEKPTKPHVFIIDEINRGNISKIFGELITLIESSKRLGSEEEISVTLPYSKQLFGVPNNVYILGTMNTADRSLTRIDTALRRRFTFKEILPDTKVLQGIKVDDIDIAKLMDIMNKRIEFLLDRDHTIGHAYFVGLRENGTMEKLAEIFRDRIIPLLQEYFYEDYQKIQMVLGDSDDDAETNFVIKEVREDTLFKNRDISGDVPDARYKINEKAFDRVESYKKIYE